ncbi:conserved Plasmodium protein, unknown function [Plasmodium ovale]|uniref:C2 NT-type domain-containing protein n=1 Tax=Plasmodium ovale TaxID=36330 RepID=A0A1D3KY81_PLAOA|nr:conserved Plasmodium protein, unknown function [Plasmodium ovale]
MGKIRGIARKIYKSVEKHKLELSVDYIELTFYKNIYVTFELIRNSRVIVSTERVLLNEGRAYFKNSIEINVTLFHKRNEKEFENKNYTLIFYRIIQNKKHIIGNSQIDISQFAHTNILHSISLPLELNSINSGTVHLHVSCRSLEEGINGSKNRNRYSSVPVFPTSSLNFSTLNDFPHSKDETKLRGPQFASIREKCTKGGIHDSKRAKEEHNSVASPAFAIGVAGENTERSMSKVKIHRRSLSSVNINEGSIYNIFEREKNAALGESRERHLNSSYMEDKTVSHLKMCINDALHRLKEMNNPNANQCDLHMLDQTGVQTSQKSYIRENGKREKKIGVTIGKTGYKWEDERDKGDSTTNISIHEAPVNPGLLASKWKAEEPYLNLQVRPFIGNMEKAIENAETIKNINRYFLEKRKSVDKETQPLNYTEVERTLRDSKENPDSYKMSRNNLSKEKDTFGKIIIRNNEYSHLGWDRNLVGWQQCKMPLAKEKFQVADDNGDDVDDDELRNIVLIIVQRSVLFSMERYEHFELLLRELKDLLLLLTSKKTQRGGSNLLSGKKTRLKNTLDFSHNFGKTFQQHGYQYWDHLSPKGDNSDRAIGKSCGYGGSYVGGYDGDNNGNLAAFKEKIADYCRKELTPNMDIYSAKSHFEIVSKRINLLFCYIREEIGDTIDYLKSFLNNEKMDRHKESIENLSQEKIFINNNHLKRECVTYRTIDSSNYKGQFINGEKKFSGRRKFKIEESIHTDSPYRINRPHNSCNELLKSRPINTSYILKDCSDEEKNNMNVSSTVIKLTEDVHNMQQMIKRLTHVYAIDEEVNERTNMNSFDDTPITHGNNAPYIRRSKHDDVVQKQRLPRAGEYLSPWENVLPHRALHNADKKMRSQMFTTRSSSGGSSGSGGYDNSRNRDCGEQYDQQIAELESELLNTKLQLAQSETKREEEINEMKKKILY